MGAPALPSTDKLDSDRHPELRALLMSSEEPVLAGGLGVHVGLPI